MEIIKIAGFTLISLILILVLKEEKSLVAVIISILSGIFILIFVVNKLTPVLKLLNELSEKSGMNSEFFKVILKVTFIAYIVEIVKSMCEDASQKALAEKLELAGKVIIITISIPIITSLLELISNMLVLI